MPFEKAMRDRVVIIQVLVYRRYEQPNICQNNAELREEILPCRYGIIITLVKKRGYRVEYVNREIKEEKDNENSENDDGNLNALVF